jgi:PKD repeat protein
VGWLWDFGDGQTSTEQNPTHVYAAVKTYTVSLTVTDNANESAGTTQNVEITNVVGIAEGTNLPDKFELSQNYPNPFNPVTSIRYALPEQSMVKLTIYDMLGQEVITLVNKTEEAGYKSVNWNGLNQHGQLVSTGIYFYRIQAGTFLQIRKMIFIK